jgi:transcriptional regulator with XRE-family HTH domain
LATKRTRAASKSRIDVMSREARLALGHRIREAREARGLDQYGLAALVKKNQGYISRIERGQFNLRIDTIATLAAALGMDMAITLTDQPEPTRRSPRHPPARRNSAATDRRVEWNFEPDSSASNDTNVQPKPRSRPRSLADRSGS